jgi:hypothetical protein
MSEINSSALPKIKTRKQKQKLADLVTANYRQEQLNAPKQQLKAIAVKKKLRLLAIRENAAKRNAENAAS